MWPFRKKHTVTTGPTMYRRGDRIRLSSTGALPAGLEAGVDYVVTNVTSDEVSFARVSLLRRIWRALWR